MQIMKLAVEVQYNLALNSTLSILPHTTVHWENSHATLGGAIYVSDVNPQIYCTQIARYIAEYVPREEGFFQLPGQNLSNGIDVKLVFKNNSADNAGSVLYGGAIDNCKLTGLDLYFTSGEVFDMLFQYEADTDYSTIPKISSDPLHICVCNNNRPDCRRSRYYVYIITAQLQRFLLTHFTYVYVSITFPTAEGIILFQCIL